MQTGIPGPGVLHMWLWELRNLDSISYYLTAFHKLDSVSYHSPGSRGKDLLVLFSGLVLSMRHGSWYDHFFSDTFSWLVVGEVIAKYSTEILQYL